MRFIPIIFVFLTQACSIFGIQNEEQPEFEVVKDEDPFQLRAYKPYLVAETQVVGDFDEAQGKAFRKLAKFIFGKNTSETSISMTAPVQQTANKSEEIGMTGIVEQSKSPDGWTLSFMMPSKYTKSTLPTPVDNSIAIKQMEGRLVATITFSGFFSKDNLDENKKKLKAWIESQGLKATANPVYAGYNPPWTIPFLKTNEVLIEVSRQKGMPSISK